VSQAIRKKNGGHYANNCPFPHSPRDTHLKYKGYLAMGGQIIDAKIMSAPKQHTSREVNEAIKEGKTPEGDR
jgi:hypothetical protein